MRARTGQVTPYSSGPHVEQVGWGVGRQVVRVLRESGALDPSGVLDLLPDVAETSGFLAYAVFEGRTATAAALVQLASSGEAPAQATYLGDALAPDASPGTRGALVVRALHDVAHAGVAWLAAPATMGDLGPLGFSARLGSAS